MENNITKEEEVFIKDAEKCLNFFGVNTSKEKIILTSGGNMVLARKSEDGDYADRFVGNCMNEIAERYAKATGKKTEWEDYR